MKINSYWPEFKSKILLCLTKWFGLILLIYGFSFHGMCQSGKKSGIEEVTTRDYEVYTSFFSTEKLPSMELPQFFEDALKAKKIVENTVIAKAVTAEELSELGKSFGKEFAFILMDYLKNNAKEFILREKIPVPDLTILTKSEREKRLSGMLVEVPSHLTGEYVSLSRAGFNGKGDKALFYIIWNGSAVVSYYVLMQKQDNKWNIKNVEMDNLIIF